MPEWLHWGASSMAGFLASLAECVEALTVVLAVGAVRGWRSVLCGAGAGLGVLTLLVTVFNPSLRKTHLPVAWLHLASVRFCCSLD